MKYLRMMFFLSIVRPIVLIVLGLNIRHRERLPEKGPAILVANHNSHLDTVVLMTLFPLRVLNQLRPVAAMDYFLRNKLISWFSLTIMNIIPIQRDRIKRDRDPLQQAYEALERGEIIILFPEGSRGEPERLSQFKSGIAHIAKRYPSVPVYPIFMHGLGKALPKGDPIFVPFFCDVFIGEALYGTKNKNEFMEELTNRMNALSAEGSFPEWE